MKKTEWKYIKPLKNSNAVQNFIEKYNIHLPKDLINFLTRNNGGRPTDKIFSTENNIEYVFKSLLSYNQEDKESIYDIYPYLFENSQLYPIGYDASGNFICLDILEEKYILLNHETNKCEKIILK